MAEMLSAFELFGNPSSPHSYGQEARQLVDRARQRVARLIEAKPEEIIFTGSGTESGNQRDCRSKQQP